jgi:hypothetical protein
MVINNLYIYYVKKNIFYFKKNNYKSNHYINKNELYP